MSIFIMYVHYEYKFIMCNFKKKKIDDLNNYFFLFRPKLKTKTILIKMWIYKNLT